MGVVGIGGFFFRAKNPDMLREWYAENLGVGSAPFGVWNVDSGPNVFSPFPEDSDYFPANRQWMLNFRVTGLDVLCGELGANGIPVVTKAEWNLPGVGRFARIHDPEGNPIELWEAEAEVASS